MNTYLTFETLALTYILPFLDLEKYLSYKVIPNYSKKYISEGMSYRTLGIQTNQMTVRDTNNCFLGNTCMRDGLNNYVMQWILMWEHVTCITDEAVTVFKHLAKNLASVDEMKQINAS